MDSEVKRPRLLAGGRAARSLFLTGCVSLHALSVYVLATILPEAVTELGGVSFFAWTATIAIVGGICGAASVTPLLARWGASKAYTVGLTSFAVGSLICAVSPTMEVLLAGRLFQGFGGGIVSALAYALIRQLFPDALHSRAIAMLGIAWGVAALLGPTFGGLVASLGDWRWAFWVDVPLAGAFALWARRVLPPFVHDGGTPAAAPLLRLALVAAAALSVSAGGLFGAFGPALVGTVLACGIIFLVFRLDEAVASAGGARLFPRGAFTPATSFGSATALVALLGASGSAILYVPYVVTQAHGHSAMVGGALSALSALSWTIVSLICGGAKGKLARRLIILGPILMTIGVAATGPALAVGNLAGMAVAILLTGVGIGLTWPHLGALILATAPESERASAGSFISTTQMFAAVFGSAIVGMLANGLGMAVAEDPSGIARAGHWLFISYAIVPALAAGAAWRLHKSTSSREAQID